MAFALESGAVARVKHVHYKELSPMHNDRSKHRNGRELHGCTNRGAESRVARECRKGSKGNILRGGARRGSFFWQLNKDAGHTRYHGAQASMQESHSLEVP